MLMYKDWYNMTLAGNETTRRLFITGIVTKVMEVF
jgi:hypothetical protein